MGRNRGALRALGRQIADAQDDALRRTDARTDRERLVRAVLAPRPRTPWKRRWFAGVALIAAAFSVLMIVARPRPIGFHVGEKEPARVGAWIDGGRAITFADGTRIDLARDARARVADVDERGASIVLETGRATASVVHRDRTRWSVLAGPFTVHVTGTRFETAWDPVAETFEVALHEGGVVVTGPLLGDGRAVHVGETLRVAVKTEQLALTRGDAPSPAAVPADHVDVVAQPPSAPRVSTAAPLRVTWQALAAHGKYKEAMAAVEREGFDGVVARSTAPDLATLGDVTRLSGESGRAMQTLNAIRARFPGTSESAASAFLLGRLSFEQRGQYAEAEQWFSTYLTEEPGGPFAREAEGRLIECKLHRADEEGAREAARRYLENYPGGPHAAKARSLLGD